MCILHFLLPLPQDVGYQHGKVVFTGWARGDIIENMLKDHRSADYSDSKIPDVSSAPNTSTTAYVRTLTGASVMDAWL